LAQSLLDTLKQNFRQTLRRREFSEAGEILARIVKEDPLSVETRGCELELYLESERIMEAIALADQLCRNFPDSARILYLAGKAAYRQKHYELAESRFRESRRIYPSTQSQYWLGKTLTQLGRFDEAEPLLLTVRDENPWAKLDLAWLHERRNDLEAALKCYDEFLLQHPGHSFAMQQQVRIKARMLDPEALIEEVEALTDFGEQVPEALFPEFVEKLFETGQSQRARDEIRARLDSMQAREGVQVAWVCYRCQAFDLACTLFLAHLRPNVANFKYLAALEAAARKCNRLPQVIDAYRPLCAEARHLYGRCRLLTKRK
jgi:tetratricopeptide (TPR) repeat protein